MVRGKVSTGDALGNFDESIGTHFSFGFSAFPYIARKSVRICSAMCCTRTQVLLEMHHES